MLTPELRHASALPDLPTYLTCPAFAVLCPPSVSCSRLIGPRSYPCLCPAPSTPAKRPKWPSEPALIARLLPIPFDAVAWHHPTTLDAESLPGAPPKRPLLGVACYHRTHVSQSAGPDAQTADSRCQEADRRRIGERRRGQNHGRRQPGGGPRGVRPQDRSDGCRRLRSQCAAHDGDQPDADGLRRPHPAARAVRRQNHVDGLSEPRR